MPATLLAFLLLTATVDPRLAEPLRLLAEVGAREVGGTSLIAARLRSHYGASHRRESVVG